MYIWSQPRHEDLVGQVDLIAIRLEGCNVDMKEI